MPLSSRRAGREISWLGDDLELIEVALPSSSPRPSPAAARPDAPVRLSSLCRRRLCLVDKLVSVVAPDGCCRGRGVARLALYRRSGADVRHHRLVQGAASLWPAEHIRFAMLGIVLFSTNFALYYNASLYAASGLLAVILSTASLVNVLMVAVITRRPPPVLRARRGGHRPCRGRPDFSA